MRLLTWTLLVSCLLLGGCAAGSDPVDGPPLRHDLSLGAPPMDLALAAPQDDLPPAKQCLPGHYVGTYAGKILLGNVVPIDTHGSVDLTLGQSGGEFFEVMNGKLMGMASKNPYSADLVGTLDCAALKLKGGMIKNGKVTVSGITYMFEGPVGADYDPVAAAFVNGTWDIQQVPMPSSSGKGTWTAKHQ